MSADPRIERNWVDIGHGHEISLVRHGDGVLVGLWLRHDCSKCPWHGKESETCTGTGTFIPLHPRTKSVEIWTVVKEEPLTIHPSIRYLAECGDHGFIRGGKWVPA